MVPAQCVPITLPPLRQRREDIPALVHHFLEKKSKDLKIYPPPTVSIEEVERLKAYHWPGNIRELENLIERELIHTRGKRRGERLTFEPWRCWRIAKPRVWNRRGRITFSPWMKPCPGKSVRRFKGATER